MTSSTRCLTASEAARRLGVSVKALRLYEQQGLLRPGRTAAGYRSYGDSDMARAAEVVGLRALGLSLAEVARVLDGDPRGLGAALAAHETALGNQVRELVARLDKVRRLQSDLAQGQLPGGGELAGLLDRTGPSVGFELPWPWGAEWFELRDIRPVNYIIGSLGSGKTRLARRLAQTLEGAVFLGLDRLDNEGATAAALLNDDADLKSHVDQALAWLVDEGASASKALTALLVGLESEAPHALIVDMIEQDLDQSTQEALITYLRHRAKTAGRPVFLLTRSSAILDLALVGPDEAIILCPANHSPPTRVAPYPGAPGYEAVATCLASPEVRARVARSPETV
ncbi:UNVERIFIED_ORG: MerR family transcriptional regulator [Burkholderia sp. CF145]|uniref:MerR family transcriptional regulator n=1 Tax=Paraburkholderia hospita TaxID=169430 RepID=UPI00027158D4|nr:MerR family transcriptional regulator [Paraburkholderia hospita]EUC12885.1 transcriptional regulator, MerR family [Burkholderia sp. BT03]SKC72616.1 transcriptional regulator, MerR family [Paraburkholderia hospita]